MDFSNTSYIRPLNTAENNFLEVLISQFTLHREGKGNRLDVWFNDETPTVWNTRGKDEVRGMMREFTSKARYYQQELDDFFHKGTDDKYKFNDPNFLFRYASGGTLPVISLGSDSYYCFFYRQIYPIGWNIANGGCDSRIELLYPLETQQRELREELLIIDPVKGKRYIFKQDEGGDYELPMFAVARKYWQERVPELEINSFDVLPVPVKWIDGPDTLSIAVGIDETYELSSCFLNINALDFGIEIDRVAELRLDESVILCDGEINCNQLVNAVIGLFQVDKFDAEIKAGKTEFIPDFFFFDAKRFNGAELISVIEKQFLPYIKPIMNSHQILEYESTNRKFDLCPVSKNLVTRYLSSQEIINQTASKNGTHDVFISCGGEDYRIAKVIFDFLSEKKLNPFFYREKICNTSFLKSINAALDSSSALIVVASQLDNLYRPWVEYEYSSFFNDIMNNRKDKGKYLLAAYKAGFNSADLPRPLREYNAIDFELESPSSGLSELEKRIGLLFQ